MILQFLWSSFGHHSSARDYLLFCAENGAMAFPLLRYRKLAQRVTSTCYMSSSGLPQKVSPNAPWVTGTHQPIPYEKKSFKSYLATDLRKAGGLYSLAISSVVPRPIALITSQNKDGLINCAPYSYFNLVSHDPPIVIIGNSLNVRSQIKKKDTLRNIEETGQFVVNIISEWYVESANHCSAAFPHEINEVEKSGLLSLPSDIVKPPRVGNAAIQMECEVVQVIPVTNDDNVHSSSLVLGKIIKFHVLEEVLTPESADSLKPIVDWKKLRPVSRMGGETFTVVDKCFDIPRPKV
jgi:flavin reductase (DIM6/NTAB) family NADH-FMN oxidoreductase RutF